MRSLKPAVMLSGIQHLTKSQVNDLLRPYNPQYVQFKRTSREGYLVSALAVFDQEHIALQCISKLHRSTINGSRVLSHYSPMHETIVSVSDLPIGVTEEHLQEILGKLQYVNLEVSSSKGTARVVFADREEADLAELLIRSREFEDHSKRIQVEIYTAGDMVIEFSVKEGASEEQQLQKVSALLAKEFQRNDVAIMQNSHNVVVSFASLSDAQKAKDILMSNSESLQLVRPPQLIGERAFVVDVNGLSPSQSVSDFLKKIDGAPKPLRTHRNALLKVAQHQHMVPTIKALKALSIGSVEPYRPLSRQGDTEYDTAEVIRQVERIDRQALERNSETRQDLLTRYKFLFNEFERLLFDAASRLDVAILLGRNPNQRNTVKYQHRYSKLGKNLELQVPEELAVEADKVLQDFARIRSKELKGSKLTRDVAETKESLQNRLFDIYIQRRDKLQLAEGLEDHFIAYGYPSDLDDEEEKKAEDNLQKEEPAKIAAGAQGTDAKKIKATTSSSDGSVDSQNDEEGSGDDESIADGEGSVNGETKNEEVADEAQRELDEDGDVKVSQFSPIYVRGDDGQLWYATIMDTDMVQKTLPGKRIASHRALIVIGNLRGTAGFGTGKGSTPALAVEAAFRASLKNLTHIDLYENKALAHDCYGKHNSCIAKIVATAPSRMVIASPFADAILTSFGIGSASVKLLGRRNPYSMVHAMFNALGKHENIDEFAKRRGKRYLTLKWLKDQNL